MPMESLMLPRYQLKPSIIVIDAFPALLDRLADPAPLDRVGIEKLNADLFMALGGVPPVDRDDPVWSWEAEPNHHRFSPPDFVGFLETSLQLVPAGWGWLVKTVEKTDLPRADADPEEIEDSKDALGHGPAGYRAMACVSIGISEDVGVLHHVYAESPERAATAACLLAIATWVGEGKAEVAKAMGGDDAIV
jgi:hypothetical protein